LFIFQIIPSTVGQPVVASKVCAAFEWQHHAVITLPPESGAS